MIVADGHGGWTSGADQTLLFQAMSAKLGIVTGRNLAELCREQFPRPLVVGMWIASEIAAVATDAGAWALYTPRRYLEEMLGSPGIFLVSARASSWILLSIMLAGIGWIVARTRR